MPSINDASEDSDVIVMDQGKSNKQRGNSRDILMKSGGPMSKNTIS